MPEFTITDPGFITGVSAMLAAAGLFLQRLMDRKKAAGDIQSQVVTDFSTLASALKEEVERLREKVRCAEQELVDLRPLPARVAELEANLLAAHKRLAILEEDKRILEGEKRELHTRLAAKGAG